METRLWFRGSMAPSFGMFVSVLMLCNSFGGGHVTPVFIYYLAFFSELLRCSVPTSTWLTGTFEA